MTTVLATDLDQTLIYSRRAIARWGGEAEALAAVERYQGVDSSFMTAGAAAAMAGLHERAVVVPTTTRTVEQLARVQVPGPPAAFAIAANGGVLLVDGSPDADWDAEVRRRVIPAGPVEAMYEHALAACRPEWTKLVRIASGLFCYAVLERDLVPAGFVADETARASDLGWQVSLQGRKIYWVPAPLTKSAAVAEVRRRSGAGHVVAAGDSLLDADLLLAADAGIAARHGELVESGWSAPHVAVTEQLGIRAGAEIVDWFAAQVVDPVRNASTPRPLSAPFVEFPVR